MIADTLYLLHELGLFGVLVDPIILELPGSVTAIRGTYDGGPGNAGNLIVYPGLSFVPVDDGHTLRAAPGNQLVIVDLPATAPQQNVDYQFRFTFEQRVPPGSGTIPMKVLSAGKVQQGRKTYYPPLLPCVTDFASIQPILLSPTADPLPLNPASSPVPCTNTRYSYNREAPNGIACDLDNDHDVDTADIALVLNRRTNAAAPGDPRDINLDGVIDANDARACTLLCTRARCAVQ